MKPDLKKLIITNLPYLLFVWLFGKMGEAWRLAAGADASQKMLHFMDNAFCKVVIRYAAINAWRDRNRRRQKEISFEYLTEEKFYPLSTSDEFLKSPYEQYPVTICGQTIILTNGELAAALLSLPEKKREISKTSTAAPLDVKPYLVKRIGNTTFDIHIHFSETSRETFTDKVVRLIENDKDSVTN